MQCIMYKLQSDFFLYSNQTKGLVNKIFLQMGKVKMREVKLLSKDQTFRKIRSQKSNLGKSP